MSSKIVELLVASEMTMVPDERDAAYREIMPIIQEEQSWNYLVLNVITYVAHRRVKILAHPSAPILSGTLNSSGSRKKNEEKNPGVVWHRHNVVFV